MVRFFVQMKTNSVGEAKKCNPTRRANDRMGQHRTELVLAKQKFIAPQIGFPPADWWMSRGARLWLIKSEQPMKYEMVINCESDGDEVIQLKFYKSSPNGES